MRNMAANVLEMHSQAESIVQNDSDFNTVEQCAHNIRHMNQEAEELTESLVALALGLNLITITFQPFGKVRFLTHSGPALFELQHSFSITTHCFKRN